MAAASQPLAVEAALDTLRQGGSAADAAVAAAAALAVLEPCSTGLGGDVFALYYDVATRCVSALNGSGRSPAGLDLGLLNRRGLGGGWPPDHALTVTVPGACAAWCDLQERFGVLDLAQVFAPAIRLAFNGFAVGPVTAQLWDHGATTQLSAPRGGGELLLDGRAPRPGERMRNPSLGRTLQIIAEGGKDTFYRGELAERIVHVVQEHGGVLAAEDMAAHASAWDSPIGVMYRGIRVLECPPNGQGLVVLLALNILTALEEERPLGGSLSTDWLHHAIEALRLAFADAKRWIADPDFARTPLDTLLSCDFARRRAAEINPARAMDRALPAGLPDHSDTVYFCVVDEEGNACSMVNSNYMGFGTGIVPAGMGFPLHNRGYNFSLDPAHPNAVAPNKRPYHTIIPAMALRPDDSLYAAFGVMGAFMQPQGHVQALSALLDHGLDAQAALDRPRFCIELGGAGCDGVAVEDGIPRETVEELRQKGHRIRFVSGYDRALFGRGQIIQRDPLTGILTGGSDPRSDGCAFGL